MVMRYLLALRYAGRLEDTHEAYIEESQPAKRLSREQLKEGIELAQREIKEREGESPKGLSWYEQYVEAWLTLPKPPKEEK